MSSNSRSILADLSIDADAMFTDPDAFHDECMENARRLIDVMEGKELPGERAARDMMKAAIARTLPAGTKVANLRDSVDELLGEDDDWTNEELAQLSAYFKRRSEYLESVLVDRLISGGRTLVRSKRLASYLYQRLRTFHDKWREAQKLFNPDKSYEVIVGKPGNYKDSHNSTFFIYMWNKEEYNFHHYLVHQLSKLEEYSESLSSVKTVADFHEWVKENPDCGVSIVELS